MDSFARMWHVCVHIYMDVFHTFVPRCSYWSGIQIYMLVQKTRISQTNWFLEPWWRWTIMNTHGRMQLKQRQSSWSNCRISFFTQYPIAFDRHRESPKLSKVRGQTEAGNLLTLQQVKLQSIFLVLKLYFF